MHTALDDVPDMFYDVHVRRGGWPVEDIDVVVGQPPPRVPACVLPVIILLENDMLEVQTVIVQASQEGLLEDGAVLVRLHAPLDAVETPDAEPGDATPDHNVAAAVLHRLRDIPRKELLSRIAPAVLPPI